MEWKEVTPNVFQRPCKGQEHSASFNQNIADGHTELSVAVPFNAPGCCANELKERIRWAWREARITHPEIAIELSSGQEIPQQMTYRQVKSEKEIVAWERETLVICHQEESYKSVMERTYDRRLPTKGKQSMMFFVPAFQDEPNCLVWNVSHAVTDAFSIIAFLNDFLQSIADADLSAQADTAHTPFSAHRLPASLIASYTSRFTPSEQETKENIDKAREQVGLYAQKVSLFLKQHGMMLTFFE